MNLRSTAGIIFVVFLFLFGWFFSPLSLAQPPPNKIYVKSDGAVDPATAPIQRDGNVYTLTSNIETVIVVQKDGVTLNGGDYQINGTVSTDGTEAVDISNRKDVTVKNLRVGKSFDSGILVRSSSGITLQDSVITDVFRGIRMEQSSGSTLSGNRLSSVFEGISLFSCSNNIITQNSITDLMQSGIAISQSCSGNLISKNTITGQTTRGWSPSQGIEMVEGTNNILEANKITSMFMAGIRMQGSPGNRIVSNSIINAGFTGLSMEWGTDGNTVTGNIVADCEADSGGNGILLASSTKNIFTENSLRNNTLNLYVSGTSTSDWLQDFDTSNTIESKPLYYWVNQKDRTVPADAGYVVLVNCASVTVRNGNFRTGQGIELAYSSHCILTQNSITGKCRFHLYSSSDNKVEMNLLKGTDRGLFMEYNCNNNTISKNTVTDNHQGITQYSSTGNTLTGNSFTNNEAALYFSSASNNSIYLNNFQNNVRDVNDIGAESMYGSSQTAKTSQNSDSTVVLLAAHVATLNFHGLPQLSSNYWDNGAKGNFWSNYNGSDANGDGVGDTVYQIYEGNQDNYPLMKPVPVSEAGSTPASADESPENGTKPDGTLDSRGTVGPELPLEYVVAVFAAFAGMAIASLYLLAKRRKRQSNTT